MNFVQLGICRIYRSAASKTTARYLWCQNKLLHGSFPARGEARSSPEIKGEKKTQTAGWAIVLGVALTALSGRYSPMQPIVESI